MVPGCLEPVTFPNTTIIRGDRRERRLLYIVVKPYQCLPSPSIPDFELNLNIHYTIVLQYVHCNATV
jgi:hypothetical protein